MSSTAANERQVVKEMAAGAMGMATASLLLNPLDVIKVRIQINDSSSRGMLSCARLSITEAGSIFRGIILPGLSATLMRDILNGAFRVGLYKEIERLLFPKKDNVPLLVQKLATGVVVGATGAGLWSHTDLVKTLMQIQDPRKPEYSSTFDAYRAIFRARGFRGLYQGVRPNMLRASIITTMHVGSYDYSKSKFLGYFGDHPVTWTLCGFISALVTTTAAAPVDLIRTRIMSNTDNYRLSIVVEAKRVLAQDGFRGFFRGWLASFSRFGPHFTISWPLIELSRKYVFGIDSF